MANKMTIALTEEQFQDIIKTMREGGSGFRPNDRIASCLVLEANLGLRIGDVLKLRMEDIVKDGARYRLDINEEKTGKKRVFTVPYPVYQFVRVYCMENHIGDGDIIFPVSERAVQKHLKKVTDYLGYENIGTHSFRKFFATEIYQNNNYNIVLVQKLLQHGSPVTTQKYIGVSEKEVEDALQKHINLI